MVFYEPNMSVQKRSAQERHCSSKVNINNLAEVLDAIQDELKRQTWPE